MIAAVEFSPVGLVLVMILALRRPPEQAAMAGAALVLLLWTVGVGAPVRLGVVTAIALDTSILFLSIAFVVVPGLAFTIQIERGGVNRAVAEWIGGLGWTRGEQVIFITLGLAPALEAMTGFGVSLIAIVPLLLSLFTRTQATRIAFGGMGIMPWGILGLPTIIGATLAHLDPALLGQLSAVTSAPVFLALALLSLRAAGFGAFVAQAKGMAASLAFVAILYLANRELGPELAGMTAGASLVLIGLAASRLRCGPPDPLPRQAWPYLALPGAILLLKAASLAAGDRLSAGFHGAQINWNILASPGLALIAVVLLQAWRSKVPDLAPVLLGRAKRPLMTTAFFLLMSQSLVKAGFLDQMQSWLTRLDPWWLAPQVAMIGGLSGYLTGSNVGGNAIAMPSIAFLAADHPPWLAAIENSAAGHGALGSLPTVALIAGLARSGQAEEQSLARFGLALAVVNTGLIAGGGILLTAIPRLLSP